MECSFSCTAGHYSEGSETANKSVVEKSRSESWLVPQAPQLLSLIITTTNIFISKNLDNFLEKWEITLRVKFLVFFDALLVTVHLFENKAENECWN